MPTPRLWYFSSVRLAPTWQAVQLAFSVKNNSQPRLALSRQRVRFGAGLGFFVAWPSVPDRPRCLPASSCSNGFSASAVVERRGAGDDRPLERGDRLADGVDVHACRRSCRTAACSLGLPCRQSHAGFVRVAHFDRVGDRADGLLFERAGAAVPELRVAQNAVVADRRIAAARLALDADAKLRVLGEAFLRMVATRRS